MKPTVLPVRLDLNLFRVLEAIHTQGGISGAARSLHVSQPAVSHALRRLRDAFDDHLFVRQGNRMQPTELTRRILPDVQAHLRGLGGLLHSTQVFEPATLEMTFSVGVRDVLEAITFPSLMQQLSQTAPGVAITSRRVPRESLERELTSGGLDLAIERKTRLGPRIRSIKLAEESLAVVMRRPEKPAAARKPGMAAYLGARHVVVTLGSEAGDPLDRILAEHGVERRVALRCQHYFAAAQVVSQTDALLTMPRTYARELARVLPLAVHEPPFPVPALEIMMYWHADRDADPAHSWLREMVRAGAQQVISNKNKRR
jgi:DNA-binding transcriptional LysR family regulator